MNRARRYMLAGGILVVVACTAGCATTASTQVEAATFATRTPPTDAELALACGATIEQELAEDGFHATRADALQKSLDWYRSRGLEGVEEHTHLPYRVYADLLGAALEQLPAQERAVSASVILRFDVISGDTEIGSVEISPNYDGRYGLTGLGFPATDPAMCEQFYVGDH